MNLRISSLILLMFFGQWSSAQEMQGYKTIKSIIKTSIDKKGNKKSFNEYEFLITKESGRTELSLNRVIYTGKPMSFKLVKAYSVTNQKIYNVASASIQYAPVQDSKVGLTDKMQAIIPMSNLEVGSTVYYSYDVTAESDELGYAADTMIMSNSTLAKTEIYRYESLVPLQSVFLDDDNYFSKKEGKDGSKYFIEVQPNQLAYTTEGKQIGVATLWMTNAPSWEFVNKKISPNYEKIINSTLPKQMQSIVEKAKVLKTSKEQIEFSAKEISKLITYSGDWTTEKKKFFPQTYQAVLQSKKGDCKDYASAMAGVLKGLGYEAHAALILKSPVYAGKERLSQLSKVPVTDVFNHAMVWAKDSAGREWWIDPTNPLVFAETLANDILGNYALVLDNESKDIKFLPDSNSSTYDMTIDQTIEISADKMVQSTGHFKLSEAGYLTLGQVVRMHGTDGMGKVLGFVLNPRAPLDVTSKIKIEQRVPEFDFTYTTKKLVNESDKKRKSITVANFMEFPLSMLRAKKYNYMGEVGITKIITRIKNVNTPLGFEEDCYVQSPWFSIERYVENKEKDLYVTDIVKTKTRSITKKESESDEFSAAMRTAASCFNVQDITLNEGQVAKTKGDLEIDAQLGPSVYKMTDEDAKKISKLSGPQLSGLSHSKLVKYYYLKLQKNPQDVESLIGIARSVRRLGYLSNSDYESAYIKDSLEYLARAAKTESVKTNPQYLRAKIYNHIALKEYKFANDEFKKLLALDSKSFETGMVASDLSEAQGSYDLAESWVKSVEKVIKTNDERFDFHNQLANLYSEMNRAKEGIFHYEKLIELDKKNAWLYHNLAIMYNKEKNYDKAIELELKAVEISPFGAAKMLLGQLYMMKSYSTTTEITPGMDPMVAVVDNPEKEKYLLEASKWTPDDANILFELHNLYYGRFGRNNSDRGSLEKAKSYLTQMIASEPNNPVNSRYKARLDESLVTGKLASLPSRTTMRTVVTNGSTVKMRVPAQAQGQPTQTAPNSGK